MSAKRLRAIFPISGPYLRDGEGLLGNLTFMRWHIEPAAALRDSSAIFAVLIAVFILKVPFTRTRMLAVLLAAAAVPLLRLG